MNTENNNGNHSGTSILVLLCILLVFSTVAYGAVDISALGILSMWAGVVSLVWISQLVRDFEIEINFDVLLIPIIALIGIGLVQLLPLRSGDAGGVLQIELSRGLSLDPFSTRIFLMRLVVYLVFFAAALTFLNSSKRKRALALFVVIFGSLMAFYGILQWLTKPDGIYGLRPTPQAIPFSSFVNQHHFAALMEMTIGLGLGIFLGTKSRFDRTPLLLFALLVMTIAILLTGSRGGILSLLSVLSVVGVSAWAVGQYKEDQVSGIRTTRPRLATVAALSIAVVVTIGAALFLGGADSLLRGVGVQMAETDFTTGRSHFWKIAWHIFTSHPIIGAGLESFGVAYTRFDTMNGLFRVEQAHNDYLQALADGGILAFTAVIAFVYFLFQKSLRTISQTSDRLDRGIAIGALAGCAGILTHSFFDFPLRTPANAFFFLILVALAVNKVEPDNKKRRRHRQVSER